LTVFGTTVLGTIALRTTWLRPVVSIWVIPLHPSKTHPRSPERAAAGNAASIRSPDVMVTSPTAPVYHRRAVQALVLATYPNM
jgi:hypothetical protein